MDLYEAIAPFYAVLNGSVSYEKMAGFIQRAFLAHFDGEVHDVLDLGCGSGNVTFPLQRRGYGMIGVDASAAMLSEARAMPGGDEILWLCQDMRAFELYGTVEGAVCTLDGINHLLQKKDVCACFTLVHNYLVPGGIFVFDVNTPYKFEHTYGNNSYIMEEEGVFCAWQNYYSKKSGRCHFAVDLFLEQESGEYERFSTDTREQRYTERQLRDMLKASGFTVLSVTNDYTDDAPDDTTERLTFVARAEKKCEEKA